MEGNMEIETGRWKNPTADFHLDQKKMEGVRELDPRAEAERQAILDQIGNATMDQIMIIQKNIAEAVGRNPDLLNDPTTIEKINAVYKRSQEIAGVSDSNTLH